MGKAYFVEVRKMTITVNEFLGMAFDNYFEFVIYDFTTERNIFESWMEKELPDEIGEMYVESWNINNGRLELNVDSGDE